MHNLFAEQFRHRWFRKMFGGVGLLLAASATSCKDPGYRTEVYPGQQGQYSVQHVPETPRPAESSAVVAAPAAAPTQASVEPAAAAPAPVDANLQQVETIWPRLSDSDKALLAETAKHLAAQR